MYSDCFLEFNQPDWQLLINSTPHSGDWRPAVESYKTKGIRPPAAYQQFCMLYCPRGKKKITTAAQFLPRPTLIKNELQLPWYQIKKASISIHRVMLRYITLFCATSYTSYSIWYSLHCIRQHNKGALRGSVAICTKNKDKDHFSSQRKANTYILILFYTIFSVLLASIIHFRKM